MMNRWQNQEEAFLFAMGHTACMLDMEMGTGKTRVAIDTALTRSDVGKVLIVCPKAVVGVWRENLNKFYPKGNWCCWDNQKGTVATKAEDLKKWMGNNFKLYSSDTLFVVVNYDIVWRKELGDYIYKEAGFHMVVLDESHRAKAAGSKVSKYLAMLGKKTAYRMCLSGTPMANSPLDVYGQYRFLNPTIFGTNYSRFLDNYAIMGGPERRFVVGFKNQKELSDKFNSIAYTCKMEDVKDRIKLPDHLPPIKRYVTMPSKDKKIMKDLLKDFVTECEAGYVVVNNVLVKLLRLQQITSGYCPVKEDVFDRNGEVMELNTAKQDELSDILSDISPLASVVVFCVFRHDIRVISETARKAQRKIFELSGEKNELEEWKKSKGAVIVVQIQAGAEGVDLTNANHAIYFSLPHSLALYDQSRARLYRPGQTRPVSFIHIIAEDTIDESMYKSLVNKKDVIKSIKDGTFDYGYSKSL